MANNNQPTSVDNSGTPVTGIKTVVYERRWELIWMTRDDIEHFESRIGDRTLFQNLALFFFSVSIPLFVEKFIDYKGTNSQTDLAIVIVCACGVALGGLFQCLARSRKRRLDAFREDLFKREKQLSSTFTMVDTSATSDSYQTRRAS